MGVEVFDGHKSFTISKLNKNLFDLFKVLQAVMTIIDTLTFTQNIISPLCESMWVIALGKESSNFIERLHKDVLSLHQVHNDLLRDNFLDMWELLLTLQMPFIIPISLDDVRQVNQCLMPDSHILLYSISYLILLINGD